MLTCEIKAPSDCVWCGFTAELVCPYSVMPRLFLFCQLFCRGTSDRSLLCTCWNSCCNRCQAPYKCTIIIISSSIIISLSSSSSSPSHCCLIIIIVIISSSSSSHHCHHHHHLIFVIVIIIIISSSSSSLSNSISIKTIQISATWIISVRQCVQSFHKVLKRSAISKVCFVRQWWQAILLLGWENNKICSVYILQTGTQSLSNQ